MFNYNAWFSVALEYGLSIFSIGKTGTSDDQLLTGGLTAVESLLGSEIGLMKKEGFVVDHGSTHMERIPLNYEDQILYGQFLIQTLDNESIDENYKELAKSFITELTYNLLESPIMEEIKNSPQKIPINRIYDILIQCHEITHKKLKIKTNNNFLLDFVKPVCLASFNNFSFSETLNSLSIMETDKFFDYLNFNREVVLATFISDIQNKVIDGNPLVFLITQPVYFKTELKDLIEKELEFNRLNQTNIIISEIIEESFKDNSLRSLLQKFDVSKLRDNTDKIINMIDLLLKEKIIQKSPVILLITPNLQLKDVIKEKIIDRFLKEFDLGIVLSNIAKSLILKAHPEDETQAELIFDFFVNLNDIFPGGLPKQLWIIIINLMQIYANEAKIDILHVDKILKIDDIFWKTIRENIKTYRRFDIANFDLAENGTELINLFNGVRESIGRSFNSFYTKFIWNFTENSFGSYFTSLQLNIMTNYQAMQTVFYLIKYLNFINSKKFKYFDPIKVGFNFQEFKKLVKPQITSSRAIAIHDMSEMDLENITLYFRKKIESEYNGEIKHRKDFNNEYDTIEKNIPKIIEKGKLKTLKLVINEKGNLKSFDLEKVKNIIIKDVQKRFKGDVFLTDTNFLFTYCTTLLFDSINPDLTNKAIDLAIYDPKSSKLIKTAIENGRIQKKGESNEFLFIENLKSEIIRIGNTVLKQLISSTIHKEISKEKYPLKTFTSNKDEILAVKIGVLDKSYKHWINENIQIHPRIQLKLESGKIIVYLEVGRRPATGINEVGNLMDAITLQTYNNEMIRFGVFIESLKIVASTLGERERNKVQNLFTSIGEFLITNY